MPTFYVDESGFTGEDLLTREQPVFVQATNDFSPGDASHIIRATFSGVNASELKYSRLTRNSRNQDRIVELIRILAADPARAGAWMAHKEYAMVTFIVEWWIEPLAYNTGLNLYKDGANHALANLLYYTLEGLWSATFRQNILLGFQQMFRTKALDKYSKIEKIVGKVYSRSSGDQAEIMRYLWLSFPTLGYPHVQGLRPRILDLALPGLIMIGHEWRKRHTGSLELVHDQSSNMAKQQWLWDAISSPALGSAEFAAGDASVKYPMNVVTTRFADSTVEQSLQICDILAGAVSALVRAPVGADPFKSRLLEAGIDKLLIDGIWPTQDFTPESLGTEGQDLNQALEWIIRQLRDSGARIK